MSDSLSCPACNKPAQTGLACERCGCDLSELHRILASASAALALANHCLRTQDWSEALSYAENAWELQHSPEAAGIAFLAAGALRQTSAALRWQQLASWQVEERQ